MMAVRKFKKGAREEYQWSSLQHPPLTVTLQCQDRPAGHGQGIIQLFVSSLSYI